MLIAEHRWSSSGTIALANDPTHRMVIVDNEALNNILDSISERINMPLDNVIAGAKCWSGKHFMDAVLSGLKGVIARNLISSKVYQQLAKQVTMLGFGHAEVVSYKRHSHLEGLVDNAYNAAALTGDIAGAFESVECLSADYEFAWEESGKLRISISKASSKRPEFEDRFLYEPYATLPGRNIFELCPVCKAPVELGRQYDFDIERGLIFERKTGHRVILIGIATLNNLFGELESELGEEIPRMIMSIEKDRVKEVLDAKRKDLDTGEHGYERYMQTLQLKGMGNGGPVEIDGDRVSARVENPYYEPLIAGFLAGFYEATTGKESVVAWTEARSGYTDVKIEPS
jgi:hypothetical protein